MLEALALARQGEGRTSPNPTVGAVIVRDGEIVGRGFHTWSGVDHAEIAALREAGEAARGAALYLTLEPCSHEGRTKPCTDAIIQAGIARVVAAIEDPNPLVSGAGFAKLRIVLDSQLRLPLQSKMVASAQDDVLVVGISAAPAARRKALEAAGVQVLIADGAGGRTDPVQLLAYLAQRRYLSLMVEAGSRVNWTMLDSHIADKVLFYYAPKVLGGLKSLPVAGGAGRQRRIDAILLDRLTLHSVSKDEFAVEAYLVKGQS
jgi:pyrimidine deaminase RibD-like protein